MGCVPGDDCGDDRQDEKPRHPVRLTRGFWMGRTEVTVEAFRRFVAETGRRTTAEMDGWSPFFDGRRLVTQPGLNWRSPGFEQGPKHPVVDVSWYDAEAFCALGGRPPPDRGRVGVRRSRRRRGQGSTSGGTTRRRSWEA